MVKKDIPLNYTSYVFPILSNLLHPIPHRVSWDNIPGDLGIPPNYIKKVGRPKKDKVREEGSSICT